jgi:hypothetical protein
MATTYDDMNGVSSDRFYTYDDPMLHARLDAAYASGVIVRDGPVLTLDQSASGSVTDGFDTDVVRDDFMRTAVVSGWGSPTLALPGQSWIAQTTGLSTDGGYGYITPAAVNVIYYATVGGYAKTDFDFMVLVTPLVFFTGARGSVYLFARYQDANNCVRFRLDFNTSQIMGFAIDYVLAGVVTSIMPGGLFQYTNQEANTAYWFRVQGNGTNLRLKSWAYGSPQPDEWASDNNPDPQWATTPGSIGVGMILLTGNTNTIPAAMFRFSLVWAGLQKVLDNAGVAATLTLDDGMPEGATNVDTTGGGQASAKLIAPIGENALLYFSPFRTDKPFGAFQDRDVSTVAMASGAVTSDGVKSFRLFTGQMTDIPLDGDAASLTAISRNRLKLSTLIQPPAVHGTFEGCELSWLIGYALYKSNVLNVPPILPGLRHYTPMNGSTHPYYPDDNVGPFGFSQVARYQPGITQWSRPQFIDGPYPGTAALDGEISRNRTLRWQSQGSNIRLGAGEDILSQTQAKGRIEYWVKGNAYDLAGSVDSGAGSLAWIKLTNPSGSRFALLTVPIDTRIPNLLMSDGTTTIVFDAGGPVPIDNQWHFVGCSWDYELNKIRVVMDGLQQNWVLSGLSSTALAATDDVNQIWALGYWPLAELRITSGVLAPQSQSDWVRNAVWTRDAVVRRSVISVDGLGQTAPREAYELISAVAQSELAKTGFDANDNFLYLSLPYWAENAQQTPLETLSTSTNLGTDFKPYRDVTKIYTQIRLTYDETAVQENWIPAYGASNLIAIPIGFSTLSVPLSAAAIEMRDVTSGLSVLSGTALAAAPPSDSNAINYITVNSATDGSGTYGTAANFVAAVMSWDPGQATLAFTNNTGAIMYVANNVNLAPMGLAAKVLSAASRSIISSGPQSQTALRGTRMLPIDRIEFIQNEHDARAIGAEIAARLGFPRTLVRTSAWGDPRRAPGQVVTLADPDQSMISGTFRITSVQNEQDGEDLRQTLTLEQAIPVAVWDSGVWDNMIWGP